MIKLIEIEISSTAMIAPNNINYIGHTGSKMNGADDFNRMHGRSYQKHEYTLFFRLSEIQIQLYEVSMIHLFAFIFVFNVIYFECSSSLQ